MQEKLGCGTIQPHGKTVMAQLGKVQGPLKRLAFAQAQRAKHTVTVGQTAVICGNAVARQSVDEHLGVNQILRNTSVPLVPPKPKLLFMATSIFILRAVLAQ